MATLFYPIGRLNTLSFIYLLDCSLKLNSNYTSQWMATPREDNNIINLHETATPEFHVITKVEYYNLI